MTHVHMAAMTDRIQGNVYIIETTGVPDDFTPPDMSVTQFDD